MTSKQTKEGWVGDEEMAKLMNISVGTLKNRLSSGRDHPPYSGKGKEREWPLDEYVKWKRTRLQRQSSK